MIGTLNDKIKAVLTVSVVTIALASIAFFITVNLSPLFIHIPSALGLSRQQTIGDYCRLLYYLQVPWCQLKLNAIIISQAGRQHFADVKNYFLLAELCLLISTFAGCRLFAYQKRRRQLWKLLTPLEWLIVICLVSLVMGVVSFPHWFISSHYLLFHNMDWIMSPTSDPVILLLPVSFFAGAFLLWCVLLLFFLAVFWCVVRFNFWFVDFRTQVANNGGQKRYKDDG